MSVAYLVDSSGTFFGQPFFNSKWLGPIIYNGFQYIVAERDNATSAFIGVFKSDQTFPGTITSWTPQDTANAPEVTSGTANAFYPKTGGSIIYLGYTKNPPGSINLITFDMNTDTYGVIIAGGPTPVQTNAFQIVHRANGDWVVGYDFVSGGIRNTYWTKYDGAWSAGVIVSTEVIAGQESAVVQMGVNATDDVIFYREISVAGPTFDYNYSVLSTAGALTAMRTLLSGQTTAPIGDLLQGNSGAPYYLAATDQWCFPFTKASGFACIAKSGPSANPTADSIEQVAAVGNASDVPGTRVAANSGETILYCLWNVVDTNHQLQYATQAIPGTTWSASTTIFDTAVDTLSPSPGITPIDVQRPSFAVTSSALVFTFGSFGNGSLGPSCDVQFAGQFAIASPLSIVCPVGGGTATIGVPYGPFDLNDDVTGGTPPYTFALISSCP